MSDAITLDVLSASPVQLDVGDADPIAREEIAELATRVTTVEGDVTALDGRMDTAEGDISTLGTTVDGIDARVEAIEADYVTSEDVMDALGGEAPALVSGSSRAVLGDAETASWMERTTAADGAALIEAIYGNTVVQDGSLLPVRMEGVETVGFNLLADASPFEMTASTYANVLFYDDADGLAAFKANLKDMQQLGGTLYWHIASTNTATTGAPVGQINLMNSGSVLKTIEPNTTFSLAGIDIDSVTSAILYGPSSGSATFSDACINISDPARNGTYEPYWSSERAIPAATYFPQGMRSAGSVRDELRADAAVTRVGAVDLGTVNWTYAGEGDNRYFSSGNNILGAMFAQKAVTYACSKYESVPPVTTASLGDKQLCHTINHESKFFIKDSAYTDAAAFKAAMSGVYLFYALATPTTTPIDPPLPLSYRTGAGGTERVMVASGTQSAPPIFVTRYPLDPADLAASIAPRESATAEANHAVGDLVMLGWTLCKVTTAIARGESITIGTNVTQTSVAAEIAALS